MTETRKSAKPLFGEYLWNKEGVCRAVLEFGDGTWGTAIVNPKLMEQFPNREIDAETRFTMDDVRDIARLALSQDPEIKSDPHAGRKLAAGFMIVATAINLVTGNRPDDL